MKPPGGGPNSPLCRCCAAMRLPALFTEIEGGVRSRKNMLREGADGLERWQTSERTFSEPPGLAWPHLMPLTVILGAMADPTCAPSSTFSPAHSAVPVCSACQEPKRPQAVSRLLGVHQTCGASGHPLCARVCFPGRGAVIVDLSHSGSLIAALSHSYVAARGFASSCTASPVCTPPSQAGSRASQVFAKVCEMMSGKRMVASPYTCRRSQRACSSHFLTS